MKITATIAGTVLGIIAFLALIVGGSIIVGKTLGGATVEEYASTKIVENCEVEGYDVGTGRYDRHLTLQTSCGDFRTTNQDDLFSMPIGETYTLEVTTNKGYVVAAVNKDDIIDK